VEKATFSAFPFGGTNPKKTKSATLHAHCDMQCDVQCGGFASQCDDSDLVCLFGWYLLPSYLYLVRP
jgi:hypothetical protein